MVVRWKMPVLAWSSWALASLCLVLAANSIDDRPNVATSLISLALYLTAAASFALPTRVSLRASDGVLTVRNPFRRHEVEVRSIREVHLGSATTPMTLARGWPVLGAVYLVEAVKRVRGMRLVGMARRRQEATRAAPAVVAHRHSEPAATGAGRARLASTPAMAAMAGAAVETIHDQTPGD